MGQEEIRERMGRNILYLRRRYGISRKALARLTGIPENRLRRVESGDPGAKLYDFDLKRIGRIFDITIDCLMEQDLET